MEPEARPNRDTECASLEGSKKTDEEERREQQTTDSSTESKGTKPKTVPRNSTTNPTTPDRNSGYKDPKDKGGARERKAKEKPEEEKEAEEQKVSKEGAATTDDGTKEDGTTKQKTNGGRVGGKGTKLPAEDAEEPFEPVSKERPVSISVCTSAYDFNVKGLVSFLKDLMYSHPKLIKEVKVHALPYNDLDHYKFPKENPVDVMLLCHSINNRRFAITDVMDALYDEYLPYCARVVGKNKMGVIVHDFEDMRETVQSSRMSSFKYKQPKAFETTSLQIICGHIEKEEKDLNQMLKVDREKLPVFLKNASTCPEEMMNQITEKQGLKQKAKDGIVTFGNQVSSSIRSFGESMTSLRWSQDSTSEGSRVDPREVDRNDQGTTCSAKTEDNKTKRSTNKRKPSSEQAKRPCLAKKNTSGGSHQKPKASMDERNLNPPSTSEASFIGERRLGTTIAAAAAHTQGAPDQQSMAAGRNVTSAPQGSHATSSPRRISISVCSSAYEHNVKGFVSKLTELQTRPPHLIADVRFRSLPYNDIDSFKFPSSDPVDVMVLCHSVQNRGFSITNVLNALYEKHLQYCHDVIGKKKLAVIVHDFSDCKPKTLEVRMESFKRSQPLTFELVDTVIVCGSLEKPGKIEMRDEDMTRLTTFFEQARYEQRENYAVKQSFYKKSFLGGLW
ncbi:uncharacterized protein LOC115926497 [Strongylocentrotus purpuratus]|uniref:Uncharacterized protein n=1 Tax=Strongylocentrotus purpuratus TaxID=7668 RepID=A0A7M7P6N9_STRPU|nr:uncharacterized protein LOC115926497 [Strongylocentrotus purpuratus]